MNKTTKKIDSFPVFVILDVKIKQCMCCGKRRLKRTLKLSSPDIDDISLGVICASKWFGINLSGNPHYAAKRLERHLREMNDETLEETLQEISDASEEWS